MYQCQMDHGRKLQRGIYRVMFIISVSNEFSVVLPKNHASEPINYDIAKINIYTVPFVVVLTFLNTQR